MTRSAAPGAGRIIPTSHPSKILVLEPAASSPPLADLLARAGHQVTRVASPAELSAFLNEGGIILLLADLRSSAEAGPTLTACARAAASLRADARPLLVAVTANGEPIVSGREADSPPEVDHWSGPDPSAVSRDLEALLAGRRLREALAEVARLHDTVRFARATAHDLAQPLTTILARAQLLMHKLPAEDAHHRPISIICQEAERMARIIEGFQSLKTMARQTSSQGH